jgi:phage terminase large subunit
VKDILWAEIAKWYQRFRLKDHLDLQTTRSSPRRESEWFAIGVASNKPENIEGFHAPHVLFVVDEAKGVQKAIYDSIDGALTTGGQRLYTSTPGSRDRAVLRIALRPDREVLPPDPHQRRARGACRKVARAEGRGVGLDSPIYQAKVLGEFPNEGDDILIRLDYILAAEAAFQESWCEVRQARAAGCSHDERHCGRRSATPAEVLGLDVARFGMDESALAAARARGSSGSRPARSLTW